MNLPMYMEQGRFIMDVTSSVYKGLLGILEVSLSRSCLQVYHTSEVAKMVHLSSIATALAAGLLPQLYILFSHPLMRLQYTNTL